MGVLSVAVTALVFATEEHHHADPDAPVVRSSQQQATTLPFSIQQYSQQSAQYHEVYKNAMQYCAA